MKLPLLKAHVVITAFEKAGFSVLRQKGSHVFMAHPDGRTTVVPNHPTEHLDRYLLGKILKKDVHMSREEFLSLL